MKKSLLAALTLCVVFASSVNAQTGDPMDNSKNDSNYDIINQPIHPAKTDLPAPFKEFAVTSSTDDDLKFTFKTTDDFDLKVVYSEKDVKTGSKELNVSRNKKFDVDLDLVSGKEYSIDILLTNDTTVYETTMISKIDNNNRILVNGVDHQSMVKKSAKGFRASYDEYEPNDTISDATSVWNNLDVYGTMSSSTDVDIFKIQLKQKTKLNVWLGGLVGSTCDYELELWSDATGTLVGSSKLGTGQDELIADKILPAGIYYAKLFVYNGKYESWRQYHFRWKGYQSWPLENTTSANITSGFGNRGGTLHKGIDIDAGHNDKVLAGFGGTVTTGNDQWKGNYVVIQSVVNGSDLQTRYYHLAQSSSVSSGSEVIAGTELGTEGNTGDSQGVHLHFETRNGTGCCSADTPTPVDPMANTYSGW